MGVCDYIVPGIYFSRFQNKLCAAREEPALGCRGVSTFSFLKRMHLNNNEGDMTMVNCGKRCAGVRRGPSPVRMRCMTQLENPVSRSGMLIKGSYGGAGSRNTAVNRRTDSIADQLFHRSTLCILPPPPAATTCKNNTHSSQTLAFIVLKEMEKKNNSVRFQRHLKGDFSSLSVIFQCRRAGPPGRHVNN